MIFYFGCVLFILSSNIERNVLAASSPGCQSVITAVLQNSVWFFNTDLRVLQWIRLSTSLDRVPQCYCDPAVGGLGDVSRIDLTIGLVTVSNRVCSGCPGEEVADPSVRFSKNNSVVDGILCDGITVYRCSCPKPATTPNPTTIPPTTLPPTTMPPTTSSPPPTSTTGISAYCLPNMTNIAVREGTLDVPMDVAASPCGVTLSVVPTSDEFTLRQITGSDCGVDPTLVNLYDINSSGLIIRTATTTDNDGQTISTAGIYIAECNDGNRTGAKLLVVHSGPICWYFAYTSSIDLSCSVSYADSTINPFQVIMTWIVNGAFYTTDSPSPEKNNPYVYTATSTITVDGITVNDYQCILTFGEPTNVQYDWFATNAPEFNTTCSGQVP